MLILIGFALLAGFVTILSPCILPVLPIILTGAVGDSRSKPLGIVTGFTASFTFFTLAFSTLVRLTGISAGALRTASIVLLAFLGLALLVPSLQTAFEILVSRFLPGQKGGKQKPGFVAGLVTGVSLGLVWTPCVGPIMAAVIALAASSSVTFASVLITLAYSIGTAVPMLAIMFGGRGLLDRSPWLKTHSGAIQKAFGVIMIFLAFSLYQGYDRAFQNWVITRFPDYGAGLTAFEKNGRVEHELLGLIRGSGTPAPEMNPAGAANVSGFPEAPDIIAGGEWFNSKPLSLKELRGKVVLVDFWTYTCINCLRTLPYLKAWHERYADQGLVIIGVHTPEFEFEKDPANVKKAVESLGLKYPVVQDNQYATWQAYSNRYWPAKYFIDKDGRIRDAHFGEGDYDKSEEFIRMLLKETGKDLRSYGKLEEHASEAGSPETYLGLRRTEGFASKEALAEGTRVYAYSEPLRLNRYAYQGEWTTDAEYSAPGNGAEISYHFSAKDVFLVMRSPEGESRAEVYLDGRPVAAEDQGKDVRNGAVTVRDDRLYHLISLQAAGEHRLTIRFPSSGIRLFAFTFG